MKRPLWLAFGLLFLVPWAHRAPAAWGYEETWVSGGGTVTGRVALKGEPPPSRVFHLIFSPNVDFCGKISDGNGNRLLDEFRVSGDGGLQDAVVAVVGVEKGKPFDYTPELQIDTCRIGPFVTPVRNGHPLRLVNQDPIAHDIQAYTLKGDYTFEMFNKPMVPKETATREVRLRKNHFLFRTQCGVHDFMQSWGIAVGNPYFAVTDKGGNFTISDLPPGVYDVIAWHPYLPVQAQTVTIPKGGRVALTYQFDASSVQIPLYNTQREYRLKTALEPHPLAPPDVELQAP